MNIGFYSSEISTQELCDCKATLDFVRTCNCLPNIVYNFIFLSAKDRTPIAAHRCEYLTLLVFYFKFQPFSLMFYKSHYNFNCASLTVHDIKYFLPIYFV